MLRKENIVLRKYTVYQYILCIVILRGAAVFGDQHTQLCWD